MIFLYAQRQFSEIKDHGLEVYKIYSSSHSLTRPLTSLARLEVKKN